MNSKIITKKKTTDIIVKTIVFVISSFSIFALIAMFGFILAKASPALQGKGFVKIFFSSDITEFGIWSALIISLITSIGAVLIALPISKRIAIIIRYRLKKSGKAFRILVDILAGVPSVIFGVFAISSLGKITSAIGGIHSHLTIFNATLMLTIMIIPTMVSLITNQLFLVKDVLIESSIALGNTKSKAIYSTSLKSIKSGIYIAAIVSLGRAIGETMATAMVLGTKAPVNVFKNGFNIFNEGYQTLATSIASFMFTDSSSEIVVQSAFAMGISLFVVIMVLVVLVTRIASKKQLTMRTPFSNKRWNYILIDVIKLPYYAIYYFFLYLNKAISIIFSYIAVLFSYLIHFFTINILKRKPNKYSKNVKLFHVWWLITWEIICAILISGIVGWIVFDITAIGASQLSSKDMFTNRNGVSNSLVWTLLLILLAIVITFPLALLTAVFLSEYARDRWDGKLIKFFLDSLGGTPSILFGIFGMIIFIEKLGLQSGGGSSLLAGGLTMMLVILPTYTRSIEQVITNVPNELREASLALGASKWETLRKIILPQTISGIVSGTILSMSRIISETAPVFLTLGMSFNPKFGLMEHGQTLTTWILSNQIYGTESMATRISWSYKFAFVTVLIITLLIFISYSIEPLMKWIKKLKRKRFKKKVIYE